MFTHVLPVGTVLHTATGNLLMLPQRRFPHIFLLKKGLQQGMMIQRNLSNLLTKMKMLFSHGCLRDLWKSVLKIRICGTMIALCII